MPRLLKPVDLATMFLRVDENSTPEEQEAAAALAEMITKVSKIRLQEVFDHLPKTMAAIALRKRYQKIGALYADEVPVVQLKEEKNETVS